MSTTKVQGDMIDVDAATVAVVAAGDKFNFLDITDSLVKEDTVQGIVDLVPAGGAWNLIGTSVASSSASLTITGLNSTYDTYAVALADIVPATDTALGWIRFGDSSGIDTGAADYGWGHYGGLVDNTTAGFVGSEDNSDAQILCTHTTGAGSAAGEGFGAMLYLTSPSDGTTLSMITGTTATANPTVADFYNGQLFGVRRNVITMDRILFQFSTGNIASGRMTVWGIAHA